MSYEAPGGSGPAPGPSGGGDERADRAWLEALFRERHADLCRFVYRYVGSREAAEDLVQDLFAAIWDARERWMAAGPALVPTLYTAARNRAFNALKRRRLEERHTSREAREEPPFATADVELRETEARDAVDRAVAALPERCRLIFTLSREGGLTYAEIASTLDLSVKTVETQMGRALKALRSRLAAHLTALSLAALALLPLLGILARS